jgi:hypothetical protein
MPYHQITQRHMAQNKLTVFGGIIVANCHIESVRLYNGEVLTVDEVIRLIQAGHQFYVVDQVSGQVSMVYPVYATMTRKAHLKAYPNLTERDNLLSLPTF